MTPHFLRRSVLLPWLLSTFAVGCSNDESALEQHARACESRCAAAQADCSSDPAFADPWSLSCEVACNLDYADDARPFDACMKEAATCDAKDACVGAGPSTGPVSGTEGDDDDDTGAPDDDDSSDTDQSTSDPSAGSETDSDSGDDTGGTTGGAVEGHACCDTSVACLDTDVLECTCSHMPGCCSGVWGEVCASIAVANGCIDDGCGSLEGWTEWNCSCSSTGVYCPDDPFVSQLIFPTDACGVGEADALAIAEAACEQGNGDGDCEIDVGSCDCTCTNSFGDSCGPA